MRASASPAARSPTATLCVWRRPPPACASSCACSPWLLVGQTGGACTALGDSGEWGAGQGERCVFFLVSPTSELLDPNELTCEWLSYSDSKRHW